MPSRDLPETQALPAGPVLVFAAHPGDELLGCGGALALHAEQGDAVHVVVVFSTEEELRERCRAAGKPLGLERYEFWDYPSGREPAPEELFFAARLLAARIQEISPRTLYAPWAGESRRDQRSLARATQLAIEMAERGLEAFGCEVWTPLQATRVLDVRTVLARKQAALREHPGLPEARSGSEGFQGFDRAALPADQAA
ncbi:MAG: PIG-L family deacetylase [Planctomycetes bacterium]|nr:PIG-L family deacetylase [Planctomycetota bacterium]